MCVADPGCENPGAGKSYSNGDHTELAQICYFIIYNFYNLIFSGHLGEATRSKAPLRGINVVKTIVT